MICTIQLMHISTKTLIPQNILIWLFCLIAPNVIVALLNIRSRWTPFEKGNGWRGIITKYRRKTRNTVVYINK